MWGEKIVLQNFKNNACWTREYCVLLCATQMQLELNRSSSVPRKEGRWEEVERRREGVAIAASLARGWGRLFKVLALAFLPHSLSWTLVARRFPSKSCPKWKQYFGPRQGNVSFSFNWLQELCKKDPLKMKNETCPENVPIFSCCLYFIVFPKTQKQIMKCISRRGNIIKPNAWQKMDSTKSHTVLILFFNKNC